MFANYDFVFLCLYMLKCIYDLYHANCRTADSKILGMCFVFMAFVIFHESHIFCAIMIWLNKNTFTLSKPIVKVDFHLHTSKEGNNDDRKSAEKAQEVLDEIQDNITNQNYIDISTALMRLFNLTQEEIVTFEQ